MTRMSNTYTAHALVLSLKFKTRYLILTSVELYPETGGFLLSSKMGSTFPDERKFFLQKREQC